MIFTFNIKNEPCTSIVFCHIGHDFNAIAIRIRNGYINESIGNPQAWPGNLLPSFTKNAIHPKIQILSKNTNWISLHFLPDYYESRNDARNTLSNRTVLGNGRWWYIIRIINFITVIVLNYCSKINATVIQQDWLGDKDSFKWTVQIQSYSFPHVVRDTLQIVNEMCTCGMFV